MDEHTLLEKRGDKLLHSDDASATPSIKAPLSANAPLSSFTLHTRLGSGSFSIVFAGTGSNGQECAVKTVRTPLRIKRPILYYEAQVLTLLRQSIHIPTVFGYYRRNHFEYLALEMFDRSLADILKSQKTSEPSTARGFKPSTVAWVTFQMLSALQHLSNHKIVHRDIKPSNMMLSCDTPPRLCLIDFGIAAVPADRKTQSNSALKMPWNATGTAVFASLHAHVHSDLCAYDDLESLAYSMFYLMYGRLPWSGIRLHHGRNQNQSTFDIKQGFDGSKLSASTFSASFGQLLDYARAAIDFPNPKYQVLAADFDIPTSLPLDWSLVDNAAPFETPKATDEARWYTLSNPISDEYTDSASLMSVADDWQAYLQGERATLSTLPSHVDVEELENQIPMLEDIYKANPNLLW